MAGFFSKKQASLPPRRNRNANDARSEDLTTLDQRYSFRRNRTLTGSISSQVVSANEGNSQLKSPRVHIHELAKKRRQIMVLLGLSLAGALGLYLVLTQFTAQVVVQARGVAATLDTTYASAIYSYFANRPIERLRFFTNQSALEQHVKQKLPEVATVNLEGAAKQLGSSRFSLTFRQPLAGWAIRDKQQYVDASGVAFSRNYYPMPAVQIIDNSGIRAENSMAVVASNRFLGFVGRTVGLAKQRGYTVTQVIIPPVTTRQVEVRLEGKNYPVKLSIDREVGEQVEDMVRTIQWFESRNHIPQYIDVRVSGKAFYR